MFSLEALKESIPEMHIFKDLSKSTQIHEGFILAHLSFPTLNASPLLESAAVRMGDTEPGPFLRLPYTHT